MKTTLIAIAATLLAATAARKPTSWPASPRAAMWPPWRPNSPRCRRRARPATTTTGTAT